ncbi:MAG TPA: hypothetical protein VD908_12525 [Cytophagales bacterium]|nr:hypothetical protein [Cytophagales bacterium]
MNFTTVFTLLFALFATLLGNQTENHKFDKSLFYSVISSDDLELVDSQLRILETAEITEKEAFEGALLMKKAGLVKNVKEKLSLFKKGNQKLEEAIVEDAQNAEYRFLRLIIQENAPGILNYDKDIEADSLLIKNSFDSLSTIVQNAIMDYSKKSKVLNQNDFYK